MEKNNKDNQIISNICSLRNMSGYEKITQIEKISKERELKNATFAGGCFWCIEAEFEKLNGVIHAIPGYTGGSIKNPTYNEVSTGKTDHYEAVQIFFDPKQITYETLLKTYFKHIDPTDKDGQFADRGTQYRPAIFYHDNEQKLLAQIYIKELEKSQIFDKNIAVKVLKANKFYIAEDYHQNYSKKNTLNYNLYKKASGRNQYLENIWKNKDINFTHNLTPLEYDVAIKKATEKPFDNKYWNNSKEGIYIDILTGEPLFSSKNKYDSGTGWPSFTKPIEKKSIKENKDTSFAMTRTEVESSAGTHLGHVFNDGPNELGGLRYCINSASLRFIPKAKLEEQGYSKYLKDFE